MFRIIFAAMFLFFVCAVSAVAGAENTLLNNDWWREFFALVGMIMPVASVLAGKTKTDLDDKAVGVVSTAVNLLAGNFFRIRAGK